MPAGVGGFISFHFAACRKISQFVRIISHRAKRDISQFALANYFTLLAIFH
jgi:hypothetical protein